MCRVAEKDMKTNYERCGLAAGFESGGFRERVDILLFERNE